MFNPISTRSEQSGFSLVSFVVRIDSNLVDYTHAQGHLTKSRSEPI